MSTYGTTPYNLVPSSLQPIQPHALHLMMPKNSAGDGAGKEPTATNAKPTSSLGPVIGSASLGKSSKFYILSALSALFSTKSHQNSWILDSRAKDHMTPTTNEFIRYEPCPVGKSVQTANGSLPTVAGIGM